jgi:SAM-dependent methyltransferase
LVRRVSTPHARIVSVGAGANPLVADLLADGDRALVVVDIAPAALDALRARLGTLADRVEFVVADVRDLVLTEPVDVWHDRATFHFLTEPEDQAAYARRAADAVRPGGHLVIATFALDGPTTCSGLPVERYDAASLAAVFADDFEPIHDERSIHLTPGGAEQAFTHVVLQRVLR